MRILWLVSAYPEPNGLSYGGVFHQTMARALATAGIEISVVAPVPTLSVPVLRGHMEQRWSTPQDLALRWNDQGVAVSRPRYLAYPGHTRIGRASVRVARAASDAVLSRPDVVHAHGLYPVGEAGAMLARRLGVPLVVTLHGSEINLQAARSRRQRRKLTALCEEAGAVIAVSRALAEETERLVGCQPRVVPIGVQAKEIVNAVQGSHSETFELPRDRFLLLYVGNLTHLKGSDALLGSLSELRTMGVAVVVAGEGPYSEEFRSIPDVRYLGRVPHDQMPSLMWASDALVLPSRSEGLPTVVCEAGACELPVIASAVGGTGELISGDRGYMMKEISPLGIIDAVSDVMQSPREASMRARRLHDHVLKYYDVDTNALNLIKLYRTL